MTAPPIITPLATTVLTDDAIPTPVLHETAGALMAVATAAAAAGRPLGTHVLLSLMSISTDPDQPEAVRSEALRLHAALARIEADHEIAIQIGGL